MQVRQRAFQQQKQKITLTSQVIQSLRLLQFGQVELNDFLNEQAERNPLIEIATGWDVAAKAGEGAAGDASRAAGANDGFGYRSYVHGGGVSAGGSPGPGIESFGASEMSLRKHLTAQIAYSVHDPADRVIAQEIVGSLEDDGYFRRDPEDLANMLGIDVEHVLAVLRQVQGFEPAGIAARDLAECLRLQLEDRGEVSPAMSALLDNLALVGNFDFKKLSRLCGVSKQEVLGLLNRLRELDPRPGYRYSNDPVLPALPDVQVEMHEDGGFTVELNTSLLPRVLIDRKYYSEIRAASRGQEDAKFVMDCMKNANWLAKNVDQRARTILQVATEIVKRQRGFFEYGLKELKPLHLRDIAEAIGMHESTIYRATTNKYVMTPRGMFELKFFFANALGTLDEQGEMSTESVRQKIRQMIEAEGSDRILSDNAIMKALQSDGIDIARRTVAKYREMLNIPTSRKRKRIKRIEAMGGHRNTAQAVPA